MKRDMDLVRAILIDVEQCSDWAGGDLPEFDKWSQAEVGYHVKIMIEVGLLDGCEQTGDGDVGYNFGGIELTWTGHEFLAMARDNTAWKKAKAKMGKASVFGFSILQALLIDYAKKSVGLD